MIQANALKRAVSEFKAPMQEMVQGIRKGHRIELQRTLFLAEGSGAMTGIYHAKTLELLMKAEIQNVSSSLQQQLKEAAYDAKSKLLANDACVKGIQDGVNNGFVTPDQKNCCSR